MKIASNKTGLVVRLGALVAALLIGQQAMAAGTRASTPIDNTVDVNYSVNGLGQPVIQRSVSFVVDRRVDFTLVPVSTPDLAPITPGGTDYFVDFLLTNTSNDDLDFDFALANVTSGTAVDGSGNDDVDLVTFDYAVVTAGDPTPSRGGAQFADEIGADATVRIRVFADAEATFTDGQIAGVELTATAFQAGGAGLGAALTYGDPNGDLTIENVDANDNGGVQVSIDGFQVFMADLTVTKAYTVIDDGLGLGTDSGLPIPGATVEYTVTIENTSASTAADSVVVTDTLNGDLTFVSNAFGTDDMTFTVNAGAPTGCTEEADADGCLRSGQDLTFDGITVGAGDTLVITYRATINDPATTP